MKIQEIPIANIKIAENYRNNLEETDLDELMQSIKQHGLRNAIEVRPAGKNRFELASGCRRLLACKKLGYSTISASIEEMDDKKITLINLTENIQRKDPTFAELGRGIDKLLTKDKMDFKQVSVRLGMDERKLKEIHKTYISLPAKHRSSVQFAGKGKNVDKGMIPHTVAAILASLRKSYGFNNETMDQVIEYVKKNQISTDQVRQVVGMMNQGLTIEESLKKLADYHIYSFEIVAPTTLVQRLMQEHKCKTSGALFRRIVYGMLNGIAKPSFVKLDD